MNFHELLAKMQQLDQPASTVEQITDEMGCGSPVPPANDPPVAPPSMSINLNAQGMDNIEDLMKLVTKVNPDMDKPPMPPLPSISIGPMDKPTDMPPMGMSPLKLGNLDSGPLKMLPDMDADNDDKPGGEKDKGSQPGGLATSLDRDNDGDHDMDDHDMEKKDKEEGNAYGLAVKNTPPGEEIKINGKGTGDIKKGEKEEAFGNSPIGGSEPEYKGMDAAVPDGTDLNRPKKSFSGKPYRGDNPMAAGAYESTDLRAQIRTELQRRLNEAKKS